MEQEIKSLYESGKSERFIMDLLGVSLHKIQFVIWKYHLKSHHGGGIQVSKDYLNKIKELNEKGLSSLAIGKQLGKDHTTILHHLKKMKLKSVYKFKPKIDLINQKPARLKFVESNFKEEKLNPGKSCYEDYLKEERERRFKQLLRGKI